MQVWREEIRQACNSNGVPYVEMAYASQVNRSRTKGCNKGIIGISGAGLAGVFLV
jgi:saccharopine dehydrogenase-like NADP-dependent oxidoreductase